MKIRVMVRMPDAGDVLSKWEQEHPIDIIDISTGTQKIGLTLAEAQSLVDDLQVAIRLLTKQSFD